MMTKLARSTAATAAAMSRLRALLCHLGHGGGRQHGGGCPFIGDIFVAPRRPRIDAHLNAVPAETRGSTVISTSVTPALLRRCFIHRRHQIVLGAALLRPRPRAPARLPPAREVDRRERERRRREQRRHCRRLEAVVHQPSCGHARRGAGLLRLKCPRGTAGRGTGWFRRCAHGAAQARPRRPSLVLAGGARRALLQGTRAVAAGDAAAAEDRQRGTRPRGEGDGGCLGSPVYGCNVQARREAVLLRSRGHGTREAVAAQAARGVRCAVVRGPVLRERQVGGDGARQAVVLELTTRSAVSDARPRGSEPVI